MSTCCASCRMTAACAAAALHCGCRAPALTSGPARTSASQGLLYGPFDIIICCSHIPRGLAPFVFRCSQLHGTTAMQCYKAARSYTFPLFGLVWLWCKTQNLEWHQKLRVCHAHTRPLRLVYRQDPWSVALDMQLVRGQVTPRAGDKQLHSFLEYLSKS